MSLLTEFRKFAVRGNVIDLAVAVVIGGAFSKIVSSFVANILMPPLNLLTARSGVNFNEAALKVNTLAPVMDEAGKQVTNEDGSVKLEMQEYAILNYGPFLQTVIEFLLIAMAIFLMVKTINMAKARFEDEKVETPPPAPPEQIVLLREIRDALNRKD